MYIDELIEISEEEEEQTEKIENYCNINDENTDFDEILGLKAFWL